MTKRIVILILFLCIVVTSCTQQRPACVEPILVSLRFSTWSTHTIDTTTNRVPFDTLLPNAFLYPLNADTSVAYPFGTTDAFSLYLNPNADSCRWVLTQDSFHTPIDTITFFYTRKLQFLSNACGYTYYYNLTTTPTTPNLKNDLKQNAFDTTHKIDSIIVENTSVTNNVNIEHLKVFIHNTQ